MANVNAPMGFQLVDQGGKYPVTRRVRTADGRNVAGSAAAALAPGDAYQLVDIGSTIRARRATTSDTVHGIVEAIVLTTKSGPESHQFVPGNASGNDVDIIGIEDPDAEFEVQADTTSADQVGMYCDVVDAAPDTTLAQSRQEVSDFNTSPTGRNFRVTRLVDRKGVEIGTDGRVIVKLINTIG